MYLRLFFIVSLALSPEPGQGQQTLIPSFPLSLEPSLSGTFGEIRTGHFHSGIDFRTKSEGHEIKAASMGYVSRLKVSATGFGKAVYIDHPTGHTTVYAHLSRFNEAIEEAVLAEQLRKKSFEIDFRPDSLSLVVLRGAVIGYSGNTGGSQGPHLHFEIRDSPTQEPLDPISMGLSLRDTAAPSISGLKVYGYYENDHGLWLDTSYAVNHRDSGTMQLTATELMAFSVEVSDFMTDSNAILGTSSIALWIDDSLAYTHRVSRFSFDETRYAQACIDYEEFKKTGRTYILLHRLPGNLMNGMDEPGNGFFGFADTALRHVRIVALDISGNSDTVNLYIKSAPAGYKKEHVFTASQTYISHDQPFSYEDNHIRLIATEFPLTYLNRFFEINRQAGDSAFLSPVFKVGEPGIPVHNRPMLSIKAPLNFQFGDKLLVVALDTTNQPAALISWLEDGWVNARISGFGRFALLADTLPPTIEWLGEKEDTLRAGYWILFKIRDDLSGIGIYQVEINGLWHVAEYDAKSGGLACFISPAVKPRTIIVTVSDRMNNKAAWQKDVN